MYELFPLTALRQRLAKRTDSEHGQAVVRLIIVSMVLIYFFSDYFATNVGNTEQAWRARQLVSLSFVVSIAIFVLILVYPAVSVLRRLSGMVHDVAAISGAIYFAEGAGAIVAVTYLWITLGNGFRFGVRYLYGCAILSGAGFLVVYAMNDYWRNNGTLTAFILLTIAVVPLYVGSLLKSLHAANDQLQRQASLDALTGSLSRAEMESSVEALFSGNRADHVLLYCDLDRFKEVNDAAGHAAGDKLLADVALIIREAIRKNDISGRIGGDEFCVLLYNCTLETGGVVAEKIRSSVAGYRLAWGTEYYSAGVSIGVAPSCAVNDAESLFRLADAACYAAKNAGRNKVHAVDPGTDVVDTQKIRNLFDNVPAGTNK